MKYAYRLGIASAILLGALAPATADADTMDSKALRAAVSGKIVYLRLAFGIELPIRYSANGTMRGSVKAAAASMAGNQPQSDTGSWWIRNDQLCQRWKRWMDGRSYCYQLSRSGSVVTWKRNDGRSGTARLGG